MRAAGSEAWFCSTGDGDQNVGDDEAPAGRQSSRRRRWMERDKDRWHIVAGTQPMVRGGGGLRVATMPRRRRSTLPWQIPIDLDLASGRVPRSSLARPGRLHGAKAGLEIIDLPRGPGPPARRREDWNSRWRRRCQLGSVHGRACRLPRWPWHAECRLLVQTAPATGSRCSLASTSTPMARCPGRLVDQSVQRRLGRRGGNERATLARAP